MKGVFVQVFRDAGSMEQNCHHRGHIYTKTYVARRQVGARNSSNHACFAALRSRTLVPAMESALLPIRMALWNFT
jgi:hypothetical protein